MIKILLSALFVATLYVNYMTSKDPDILEGARIRYPGIPHP